MPVPAEPVIASSREDAEAVQTVRRHHAELTGNVSVRVEALLAAATDPDVNRVETARADLVRFCEQELLPHAMAEETTLYRAASQLAAARLLVNAMVAEHGQIVLLVQEVATAPTGLRAGAAGRALAAVLTSHVTTENDVLLPVLASDPGTSLAGLLVEMHKALADPAGRSDEALAPSTPGSGAAGRSGGCGCGGHDDGPPELDVRVIPHSIRHATVFGAFDGVPAGGSLVLVAPHDPLPLLRQLTERAAGHLDVTYLERGPEAWRLRLTK